MSFFALLSSASIASQALILDPGPDWHLDGASNDCTLSQRDANSRDTLEVSQYPASDELWLTLADRRVKASGYKALSRVTFTLEPGASHTGDGRLYPETDERSAAIAVEISDPAFLQEFANASSVVVSYESLGSLRRSVRSTSAAVHALAQCEDQRLRGWGIDPAYWRGLKKPPHPLKPLGGLLSPDDYPPGYVWNGVNGGVVVRLTVGTDGRVKDCVGLNRRVDRYILQNVCGKLKAVSRFEPAVDARGHQVEAPYVTGATFKVVR